MCMECQVELASFRNRAGAAPWKLNRTHVADRLQEILNEPASIYQGPLRLCGPAAFLRSWILRDHLAVVRFTINLYENGKSAIGDYAVEPCDDLLAANYESIAWGRFDDGRPKPPCPPAEWMIMSALQDAENAFVDFEGTPVEDSADGMWPSEVAEFFDATKLYQAVENETATVPANYVSWIQKGVDHALSLEPDQNTDIVLMVNSQLIGNDPSVDWNAFYKNHVSNHFIGLCSKPTKVSDTEIRMKYFTWGFEAEHTFNIDDFRNHYYGALISEAKSDASALPFGIHALPAVPSKLSARVSGMKVTLYWTSTSLNDNWYSIERRLGSNFKHPDTHSVSAARPSTLGASYVDDLGGTSEQFVYYRVQAHNKNGYSEHSDFLAVNLKTGTAHVANLDAIRPPTYVKQVIVLRAPPGLQPSSFANLGTPEFDCLEQQTIYDAIWEQAGPRIRTHNVRQKIAFRPDRQAYVFVRFADFSASQGVAMNDRTVSVKLVGSRPGEQAVSVPVTMVLGADKTFYWGSISPTGAGLANLKLKLEIHAEDSLPRVEGRVPSGREIDSDPSSEAYVDDTWFTFCNYQPGVDRNHELTISSVPSVLPADAFEPNNDFATATKVKMVAGKGGSSAGLDQLTLGNREDKDHFLLELPTTADDEASQLLEPKREVWSQALGLSVTHYPPELIIELMPLDKQCLDLALHSSQTLGWAKLQSAPRTSRFSLYNPVKAGFGDKQVVAVVSNTNFDIQGALQYAIRFTYVHARVEMHVDHNAPAYKPRTPKVRAILRKLYEALDLPRPGIDVTWIVGNGRTLAQKTAAFLLKAQVAGDLQAILKKDLGSVLAKDFRLTARIARGFGLMDETEKLLTASAERYRTAGNLNAQMNVLKDLQKFYLDAGMKAKADSIKSKLSKVLTPS